MGRVRVECDVGENNYAGTVLFYFADGAQGEVVGVECFSAFGGLAGIFYFRKEGDATDTNFFEVAAVSGELSEGDTADTRKRCDGFRDSAFGDEQGLDEMARLYRRFGEHGANRRGGTQAAQADGWVEWVRHGTFEIVSRGLKGNGEGRVWHIWHSKGGTICRFAR